MKVSVEIIIKIALSILLLLCLFHMPYGYYQLFRYLAIVGFAILAYYEYERRNVPMAIVFVGLILLFQPFSKVGLGRETWNIVDVVIAVGLVISIFMRKSKNPE